MQEKGQSWEEARVRFRRIRSTLGGLTEKVSLSVC